MMYVLIDWGTAWVPFVSEDRGLLEEILCDYFMESAYLEFYRTTQNLSQNCSAVHQAKVAWTKTLHDYQNVYIEETYNI